MGRWDYTTPFMDCRSGETVQKVRRDTLLRRSAGILPADFEDRKNSADWKSALPLTFWTVSGTHSTIHSRLCEGNLG